MKKILGRSVALVLGSFAVYAGVACAVAVSDKRSAAQDAGAIDAGPLTKVDTLVEGVLDALMDAGLPKDASAGPVPDQVSSVACTTRGGAASAGSMVFNMYASQAYPGRTKEDLSRGRAVACGPVGFSDSVYPCRVAALSVRDGEAAVFCGQSNATGYFPTTIEIIMPAP